MILMYFTDQEGFYNYWLGGTDKGRYGKWYWANSLETVQDFVWFTGEPNGGTTHNCMLYSYIWDSAADAPCDNTYYPLCQIPIEF